jgi:cation/acetate symporter
VNVTASIFFAVIVVATLGITYWASKRNRSTEEHYVADGKITGWQTGLAITGDFVSVGGFLGITGARARSSPSLTRRCSPSPSASSPATSARS